jgi:hypothetical protein
MLSASPSGFPFPGDDARAGGFAAHQDHGLDPVEAYFECITSCSLDDGECITTCTTILREHS